MTKSTQEPYDTTGGTMPEADVLLTTREAADLLGLSPRTLQGYRYRGAPDPGLPFVKFGQSVRYRRRDVLAFVDARTRSSTSDDGSARG